MTPTAAVEQFCGDVRGGNLPVERRDVPHDRPHGRGAGPLRRRGCGDSRADPIAISVSRRAVARRSRLPSRCSRRSVSGCSVRRNWSSGGPLRARLPLGLAARAAATPFAGYRVTSVDIDGRCRPVVVADTASRRERGLARARRARHLRGHALRDSGDTDTGFTMSGVGNPLEISWYSAAGERGRRHAPRSLPGSRRSALPGVSKPAAVSPRARDPGWIARDGALAACG